MKIMMIISRFHLSQETFSNNKGWPTLSSALHRNQEFVTGSKFSSSSLTNLFYLLPLAW